MWIIAGGIWLWDWHNTRIICSKKKVILLEQVSETGRLYKLYDVIIERELVCSVISWRWRWLLSVSMHSLTPDIHNTNAHYFYSDALCMSSSETFWWMVKGFAYSYDGETELAEVVRVCLVLSSSLSFAYSEYLKLKVYSSSCYFKTFSSI